MSPGAIILNLLKGRQAERFGIREGDVIVKIAALSTPRTRTR